MEQIDVLSPEGHLTGVQKLRSEVHRDGDWHRSVHVWIITPTGEVLIQRRSSDRDSYPNMWALSTSGHIAAGNNSIATAIKEVHEELGLEVGERDLEQMFTAKNQRVLNDGAFLDNEFNDFYLIVKDLAVSSLSIQKEELSEVKLMPFRDLRKIIENKTPGFIQEKEHARLFEELDVRFKGTNV
jgi:isopentenyldiphosphate isomerase